jgi:hypothetical protein
MPFKDLEKRKEYKKQWHQKNIEKRKISIKKRKQKIIQWFNDYKKTLKCEKCGETHPATIDFHHKNEKKYGLSKMVYYGYSKKRIQEEISKCQVLCANCHRKIHWKNK